jgi:pSer/pThr/pTyr-binding forkhead associated (FHA) protein
VSRCERGPDPVISESWHTAMEVKLVVTNGRHSGREIPIRVPKFFIGRAEDCHLRPGSDLVSRHHCVILVEGSAVAVRDFGSKNGTFVNGEQVMPERELKNGDRLVVGQLDFDVQISGAPAVQAPAGEPEAKSAPPAKSPPAAAKGVKPTEKKTVKMEDDLDISQWFGDGDASARTDTQTIDMSTVAEQELPGAPGSKSADLSDTREAKTDEGDVSEAEKERRRRDGLVGVSKTRQAMGVKQTTQDAAAEMLKKFFSGRR